MRDGRARRLVKRLALGVLTVKLGLHRARARTRGDIRYELGGACDCSGTCCEAPGIQASRLTWYFPLFRKIFLWWHRWVNGFEDVSRGPWKKNGALHSVIRVSDQAATSACSRTSLRRW